MKRSYMISGAVLLIVLGIAGFLLWPKGEARSRVVATQFVEQLQNVSLTADEEEIKSAIRQHYAEYVTSELLAAWEAAPRSAPGRESSSPWPDRIFIKQVSPQGTSYLISADVLYVTSVEEATPEEDAAGVKTVTILVSPTDDGWRISAYAEQFSEGLDGTATTTE